MSSANLSVGLTVGLGLLPGLMPRFSRAFVTKSLHSSNSFSVATSYASLPTNENAMTRDLLRIRRLIPSLFRTVRSAPARMRVVKMRGLLKKQATMAAVLLFKSWALTLAPCCNSDSTHSGLSTMPKDVFVFHTMDLNRFRLLTSAGKVKCCAALIVSMINIGFFVIEQNSSRKTRFE